MILDARNLYESRIGRFQVPGVRTLLPPTRCFSDLPAWMDANGASLRGRRVLMYCTGGVRCERASAYLRSKGPAFADAVQLRGGIQRYLETIAPDRSFFAGKNFVFDERGAVDSGTGVVTGACQECGDPHDDYSRRRRCGQCRMLVLVCDRCAAGADKDRRIAGKGGSWAQGLGEGGEGDGGTTVAGEEGVGVMGGTQGGDMDGASCSGRGDGDADNGDGRQRMKWLCELCRGGAGAAQRDRQAAVRRDVRWVRCFSGTPPCARQRLPVY